MQGPEVITGRFDEIVTQKDASSYNSSTTIGVAECRWSPYTNNGGTALAVTGDGFAICVADVRLSSGMGIHSRRWKRWVQLTPTTVLASSGMQADIATLHKIMVHSIILYEHQHKMKPSFEALAQLLSTTLYNRRFFPLYTFNLLVGLKSDGTAACCHYDAVGSFSFAPYDAVGSGSALALSVFDNQIGRHNQNMPQEALTRADAIDLAKDVITSVAERDVFTGDGADVIVIEPNGLITVTFLPLRTD